MFQLIDREGEKTLVLRGEIDLSIGHELRRQLQALVDPDRSPGLVDLSGVTFLDSTGLAELIGARKEASRRGGELVLVAPSDACTRLLEITAADQLFEIRH